MTRDGLGASASSNNNNCADVLCLANTLKLAPPGTNVAPSGKLLPGSPVEVPRESALRVAEDALCVSQDRLQVLLILEAFGVDFVNRLGSRRSRREPAAPGDDLEATDRHAVSGGARELCYDRLTGRMRRLDRLGRQFFEPCLLFWCRGRVD